MKLKRATVVTDHENADIVAMAMFDAGAEGTEILDRADFADLERSGVIWDYADESVTAPSGEVKVSAVVPGEGGEFIRALEEELSRLRKTGVKASAVAADTLDDADWANEWKKYYTPVVTASVTVVPSWTEYSAAPGERIVRLDPGMAFGTGAHETTRMCLELMGDPSGRSVIDIGCGSGILGIAAAVSGAASVYMCDIDPQAVEAAHANARLNGVCPEIEEADLLSGDRRASLIFANLTADILMRLAPAVGAHLDEGGTLIVSGIIASRAEEVLACFAENGFGVKEGAAMGDWRAYAMERA